jgi:general secretion pathway protein L
MRNLLSRQALETLLDRLLAGWFWWLAELRGLVPGALRRRLAPARPVLRLDFDGDGVLLASCSESIEAPRGRIGPDELAEPLPPHLAATLAATRFDHVELRLPAEQVLHQRIALPLASPRRLTSLLGFELDRQTPFTPEQVYFDAHVIERDPVGRRMMVELAIVKRGFADRALGCARRWGLEPRRLGIIGESGWAFDFRPERPAGNGRRHLLSMALAATAIFLTLAAWFVHAGQQAAYADALALELASSRNAAELVKAMRKELDAREARIGFLARRKRATDAGRILEELASKLPDDTWITEFELNDKSLHIRGFSSKTATLPTLLGASALLGDAGLSVPPDNAADRFDLSAVVREGGDP